MDGSALPRISAPLAVSMLKTRKTAAKNCKRDRGRAIGDGKGKDDGAVRALDLCSGHGGWTDGLLAAGFDVIGFDVKSFPQYRGQFIQQDILALLPTDILRFAPSAIVCSSPCEEFSLHCMRHFHPNPPYPQMGIRLFNHARLLCESAGIPYVMENVRCAEQFVGRAVNHCGPFYLWGSGVPVLLPQNIKKGKGFRGAPGAYMEKRPADVPVKEWRNRYQQEAERLAGGRRNCPQVAARIPLELAKTVAEYLRYIIGPQPETNHASELTAGRDPEPCEPRRTNL